MTGTQAPNASRSRTNVTRRLAMPAAGLAALALVIAPTFAVGAGPADPFRGAWESTDTDGSHQRMTIGGSGDTRRVTLHDDLATSCGEPLGTARAFGVGTRDAHDAHVLTVEFDVRCQNGGSFTTDAIPFTSDSKGETLRDAFGVTWFRPGTCTAHACRI